MGQMGSAFKDRRTFEPDPQGFSGSEWAARGIGSAGKGLAKGFSNYTQQNQALRQGGGFQIQPDQGAAPAQPDFLGQAMSLGQGPGTGQAGSMPSRKPYTFWGS